MQRRAEKGVKKWTRQIARGEVVRLEKEKMCGKIRTKTKYSIRGRRRRNQQEGACGGQANQKSKGRKV